MHDDRRACMWSTADVGGRVVVLNGASSTGKTSIACSFHDRRASAGEFWFRSGIDDVLSKLTHPWLDVGWPGPPGQWAADGMRIVTSGDDPRVEVGATLRSLLEIYQDGVARTAGAGIDVIVDECMLDAALRDRWVEVLSGIDVRWVAVRCDSDVMRRREAERGDRPVGLAAAQANSVHLGIAYDLEIDTTDITPDAAAAAIDALLAQPRPSAGVKNCVRRPW
jgi:chloramphenicol 3-O phosphotransferase